MGVKKDWSMVRAGLGLAVREAMALVPVDGPAVFEEDAIKTVFEAVRKGQPDMIVNYIEGLIGQVPEPVMGEADEVDPGDGAGYQRQHNKSAVAPFGVCLMAIYHASLSANQSLVVV